MSLNYHYITQKKDKTFSNLRQELVAIRTSDGSLERQADQVWEVFCAAVQDEREENPEEIRLKLGRVRAADEQVARESSRAVQTMFHRLDVTLEKVNNTFKSFNKKIYLKQT